MVHLPHRNYKNSIWKYSQFHLEKLGKSHRTIYRCNNSKRINFCNVLHTIKVLEWSIYPIESIKIRFGSGLDLTSKICCLKNTKNPIKTEKNQSFKKSFSVFLSIPQIYKCTKFHTNRTKTVTARLVTKFIRQTHRQTDRRQTDDTQTDKIFIAVSESQGSKTCRKKVSAQSEEK